ncbi:hypothetical protein LCGC14_0225060 [marine sediment metagenome]|uniref:Uncharacterized protein n=1 Tax=marine sediment metagenome TaxID=412755 RepID=A0A0F9UTX2_9ZZZZ
MGRITINNVEHKFYWDSIEDLERIRGIVEEWLVKGRQQKGVFTLQAEIFFGQVKSALAKLKGERVNIVKCIICGGDIDLNNDFDCWKDGDKYSCMNCGISKLMGFKQ